MLPCTGNNQIDKSLTRKGVKLALKELKQNNAGVLLSERAVKVEQRYSGCNGSKSCVFFNVVLNGNCDFLYHGMG